MTTATDAAIADLRARLDAKVSVAPADLATHGHDENFPDARPPLAVVFAEGEDEVLAALAWAREHGTPVIPFGAGTSFEGQLVPQGPAISLDLSRMARVLEIGADDFLAVVEPGLTRTALNTALRHTGLFFPVDPGADASLGGMAATNASGTTTVRYGGMRQNVAALRVALANGETLDLGRPVRKTSSGYDLKDLFIGSAGTLGVITRLVVRLHPVPEHIHTLRIFFPSLVEAAQAAYSVMASALPVARIELVDELGMRAINRYRGASYAERPALFLEFHSSTSAAIEDEARLAEELAREAGALDIDRATTPEERTAQWEARHHIYWALVHQFPGHTYTITDTAVPISRVAELVGYTQDLLVEMRLPGSIVGHVGDGNFHTLVATLPGEYGRAEALSLRLVERALELGGTATGEHGVGITKKRYMPLEHGPALEWMRRVKQVFDPDGLLNPGKIL
jgi:D-lactate dehydrogenase (cytochrome)